MTNQKINNRTDELFSVKYSKMLSFSLVAEALTGLIYHRPSGENFSSLSLSAEQRVDYTAYKRVYALFDAARRTSLTMEGVYALWLAASGQLHSFTGPRMQVAGPQDYRSRAKYHIA